LQNRTPASNLAQTSYKQLQQAFTQESEP